MNQQETEGVEYAWNAFLRTDPASAVNRSGVSYDQTLQLLTVRSFGQDIFISRVRREVFSDSPEGNFLLQIRDYFFDLSTLWYLIGNRDFPLTGELVKPASLPGGQIFVQGTHVLPLDAIARRYNNNKAVFLNDGRKFGGIETGLGDAGLKLMPFPRMPVYLILWFGDHDFPPKGQLLLDSSCPKYFSTDVIWAVTMVCCLIFLDGCDKLG